MGKFKKTILIIPIIIISIIILWVLVYNLLNYFTSDIPSINDKDFQLGKAMVYQEENAYYDLIKIKDVIYWKWPDDKPRFINRHAEGEIWDEEFVEDLLLKNKQAFEYFDQAVKKSKFQDPTTDDQGKMFSADVFIGCKEISDLSAIKALYLARDGKKIEALEEAMKSIRLGQYLQESQLFPTIQYVTAINMKNHGVLTMQRIITSTDFPSETLISYIQKVDEFKNNEDGLKTMWKIEYLATAKFIDLVSSGNIELLKQLDFTSDFSSNQFKKLLKFGSNNFYFRPNETKLLFAEYVSSIINDAEKPYGLAQNYDVKKLAPPPLIKSFFTENAIGKILFILNIDALNSVITAKYNADSILSATQLIFAIKAFKVETGSYPISLNLLVPKYISNVPEDSFDGKPIRYSFEKGIIYSVGKDLMDDGGSNEKDVVFKIGF